jgi:regulatory protein
MVDHDGGEDDHLAPVIPLFGGESSVAPAWRSTWDDDGARPVSDGEPPRSDGARATNARGSAGDPSAADGDAASEGARERVTDPEAVERMVLRKLGSRPLSVAETRSVIAGHHLDEASVEALMRGLLRHGYLDDAALADQLVRSAVERRGQGRHVIAQSLAKRRIPKDVADAALATLPDDDADRALEFAATRARSMARLDHETALRRLVGQLSRRGYPSSVAMSAARRALDEASGS